VSPDGEIDLSSAPLLKTRLVGLLAEGYSRLVLDLSAVRYIDSTGLGVLVGVSRRLPGDGLLTIAHAPATVVRLLELTGLDRRFETFLTVEDALAHVSHSRPSHPSLCSDAAIVVGMAVAALPFAESEVAEVQRWLRVLRIHGEAAQALNCLGLSDPSADPSATTVPAREAPGHPCGDSVARVTAAAAGLAVDRDSPTVSTIDLLLAVMMVYGDTFDQTLRAYGTGSVELIECLGSSPVATGIG
jgi:anti-sigma B factor antagonist